jgi:hypothetical protein
MNRLIVAMILLAVGCAAPVAAEQVGESAVQHQSGIFTGIHRNEGVRGRAETATLTDGKTYKRLAEQEYRAGGYWPPYEKLPLVIVRRLLGPIPVTGEDQNDLRPR